MMKKTFTNNKSLLTIATAIMAVVIGSSAINVSRSLTHAAGSSVSGSSGGCSCHTKGVAPGGVSLVGLPTTIQVGSVDTFTLHVNNNKIIAQKWGFAMSATGGTLSSTNSNVGKATTGALYHKAAFAKADSTYDIANLIVTAPATAGGTIAFKFAAMAGTNASGSTGHGYKGTLSVKVTDSTLPITLSSFIATASTGKVNLAWATETELNVAYFGIERSVDGINYVSAGKVTAVGNSISNRTYSFSEDATKLSGTIYYRLKTVDKDGKSTYSAVKQVVIASKNVLTKVYPNPLSAGQDVKLAYTSLKSGVVKVQVLNSLGKQVVNSNLAVTSGSNTLSVSGSHLAAGIYYVSVIADNNLVERLPLVIK
jgi:hypothetical protein